MKTISLITRYIDCFTEVLGRIAAWCAVAMVLVTCYIVVSRYVFNSGSIAIQESVIYLNALLFILTAGFTLKHNAHVRVDVFYSKASPRYRHMADLLGTILLLLPVCIFIFLYSWDYVMAAWRTGEQSRDPGGLPWVYLLKTLILVLSTVLVVQGVAELLRNIAVLFFPQSRLADTTVDEEPAAL